MPRYDNGLSGVVRMVKLVVFTPSNILPTFTLQPRDNFLGIGFHHGT
jgi:hypothetical protein